MKMLYDSLLTPNILMGEVNFKVISRKVTKGKIVVFYVCIFIVGQNKSSRQVFKCFIEQANQDRMLHHSHMLNNC